MDFKRANKLFVDTIANFHEDEINGLWSEGEDIAGIVSDEGFSIYEAFDLASMRDDESYGASCDVLALLRQVSDSGESLKVGGFLLTPDIADRAFRVHSLISSYQREEMESFSVAKLIKVMDALEFVDC